MKAVSEIEMEKFGKLAEEYKSKSDAISSILYALSGAIGTGMEDDLEKHTKIWTTIAVKRIEEHQKRKNN